MSKRDEKFHKLGNAIRQYRGRLNTTTGKWITPPNFRAARRVERYLRELGLDVVASAKAINGFKTFDEMRAWMREAQKVTPLEDR